MLEDIQSILRSQKTAFEEIMYYLTEPGISINDRSRRLLSIRERTKAILQELAEEQRKRNDPAEKALIDEFILKCKQTYKEKMEEMTNTTTGGDPYSMSSPIATMDKPAGSFQKPKPSTTPVSSPPLTPDPTPIHYASQTTNEYNFNKLATKLNVSTGIKTVDGEPIPNPAPDELFYVLSPWTDDNFIIVTRFISAASATGYVYENYRNDMIQPMIIFGKLGRIQHSINLEV